MIGTACSHGNGISTIDGIEDTRTLVAILFPEPDQEDRDQFSAWS